MSERADVQAWARRQMMAHVEARLRAGQTVMPRVSPPPRANPPVVVVPAVQATSRPTRDDVRTWTSEKKLAYLRETVIGDCQRCPLCQTRSHLVFGVGSARARVMFVGEAPGADEDAQGEPFVGRAGARLNLWLQTLGWARSEVYIANILKCRPPDNRDPQPLEVARCTPFLQAQIRAIQPAVIVALGRHAGMFLSKREHLSLAAMRQEKLTYDAGDGVRVPLAVTYHPAYVLRQERAGQPCDAEEAVLADLRRVQAHLHPLA